MVNSMNAEKGMLCWGNPGIKKVGKCHAPHSTPRIRLAESIDLVASSLGRAYPRQPISSPTTRMKRIGSSCGRKIVLSQARVAVRLLYLRLEEVLPYFRFSWKSQQNEEPTSGLEPLTCSLRVRCSPFGCDRTVLLAELQLYPLTQTR